MYSIAFLRMTPYATGDWQMCWYIMSWTVQVKTQMIYWEKQESLRALSDSPSTLPWWGSSGRASLWASRRGSPHEPGFPCSSPRSAATLNKDTRNARFILTYTTTYTLKALHSNTSWHAYEWEYVMLGYPKTRHGDSAQHYLLHTWPWRRAYRDQAARLPSSLVERVDQSCQSTPISSHKLLY